MSNPLRYSVHDSDGRTLMYTDSGIRYPPETELSMLSAGYTIRRNGKRITKKEIMQNAEQNHRNGPFNTRS